MKRFDAYVRVSDVRGRSGDRFLSPELQTNTIRRLAQANGLELNEPTVEELDVSGGKRIEDRELGSWSSASSVASPAGSSSGSSRASRASSRTA
jgi:hypothetical protein